MGIKDSFMGASTVVKIVLIVLLCANLFNWIAFTTTGWATSDRSNFAYSLGIWRTCQWNDAYNSCGRLDGAATDWMAAFQAFSIFGFVSVNVSCALVILFLFVDKCKGDKEMALAVTVTGIIGAVTWLIAVIVYADNFDDKVDIDLDYSFALAIIALILSAVGGVAMIFGQAGGASTKPAA